MEADLQLTDLEAPLGARPFEEGRPRADDRLVDLVRVALAVDGQVRPDALGEESVTWCEIKLRVLLLAHIRFHKRPTSPSNSLGPFELLLPLWR